MPQDARAARPGRRREIPRLPHDRLMAEERERHGFFGLAGEEGRIKKSDGGGLDLRGQPLHARRIFRPTAGDAALGLVILPPARRILRSWSGWPRRSSPVRSYFSIRSSSTARPKKP